ALIGSVLALRQCRLGYEAFTERVEVSLAFNRPAMNSGHRAEVEPRRQVSAHDTPLPFKLILQRLVVCGSNFFETHEGFVGAADNPLAQVLRAERRFQRRKLQGTVALGSDALWVNRH